MKGYVKHGAFSRLVIVVMIVASMVSFCVAITDPSDVAAINTLYSSLENPPLQGWVGLGGDPCGELWQGVDCVFSNITALKLSGLNLGGCLPDVLFLFESIIEMDLSNNRIGGTIPSNLPVTLRTLSLAGNRFNGSIPYTLSTMSQLTELSLGNNLLSGEIPDAFVPLTSLVNLDVSGNNLTGHLPPSMGNLSALALLHVQNNKLTGRLDVLKDLPLQDLNVENNLFWGPIPANLLNIPNFRKDGNPFNTTVLPSPPIAIPPVALSPTSPTFAAPPSLEQTNGSSALTSTKSQGATGFFSTGKIVLIAVFGVVIIIMLGLCILMIACCKRRQVKEDSESQGFDSFKGHAEKPKSVDVNISQPPLTLQPPASKLADKVIVNPKAAEAAGTSSSSTKNLNSSSPVRVFTIATLQLYTNSFSEENLVGEGTLGSVYRAELPDGQVLAVKKLNSSNLKQKTDEEFLQLVSSLSKIRHPNILQLLGYCNEHGQRLLVYEYCKFGTLYDALHVDDEIHHKLSWETRISLALGAARALQYIHEVCQPPIIHQNFKSGNILLGGNLTVHVSDCGLAELKPPGYTDHGYGAPELDSGSYTSKSDIYSFGVVMLELLTGRKPYDRSQSRGVQSLVRWAVPRLHDIDALSRMVDPSLKGAYPSKSLSRFADIISRCIQSEPEFRPPISEIAQDLTRMWSSFQEFKPQNVKEHRLCLR